MKTIVYLLLTFSLAHANVYKWIPETEKIFLFDLKAPTVSPGVIPLGIQTEVRVQVFADHTFRMKFEGAQVYCRINNTLVVPVGRLLQPFYSQGLDRYLEETVLVQLKGGNVKSFFVGRDEPYAVTNIKRSFLFSIDIWMPSLDNLIWNEKNGLRIEYLRDEPIVARLPLPSKTRQETSLLPTIRETKSSALEGGPVGQVRLCDSDKDCPEGTRCKSHCNRYACVVQCIPIPDNHPVSTNQLESTGKKCALCCILGGMNTCPIWYKVVHLCDNCLKPNNEQKEIISPKSIPGSGCADDVDYEWYDYGGMNGNGGYDGYGCSLYKQYCSDSYTGDWYRQFRAACKSTCSQYASSYCTNVTCLGCADEYLGYDMATMKNGYNCEDYKAQCRSDYSSEWSKKVRAACKNTCSHYASEYCTQNTCKAIQGAGFHIAAQGKSCSDIGQMSMKSGFECKEAATAFGKVIKSEINAEPGWCIFHNNEVYWDIQGAGLWKPESQEICSNDGWFPGAQQGTSDPDYQVMSQETMSHNKAAIKRIKKSPNTIAKRIGEAATWTWDFIKTPFA